MSDNPFQEDDPGNRTIIRPTPGGRALPAAGAAPPRPLAEPPELSQATTPTPAGLPTLLAVAAPLLDLLGSLSSLNTQPDAAALRQRTMAAVRRFDAQARAAGIPAEVVGHARYVLCASLDDNVLSKPWGRASPWMQESLVSFFHKEVVSGEHFYLLLKQLQQDPLGNQPLLTLMYACMALGYLGQYRVAPHRPAEAEAIRENLYAMLRRVMPAYDADLSPQWRGVDAPYRPGRAQVPVWVVAAVCMLLAGLAWGGSWLWLGARAEQIAALGREGMPPARMPALTRMAEAAAPPPAPPQTDDSAWRQRLAFLQPQIDRGVVAVDYQPGGVHVTLLESTTAGLFDSGSAELHDSVAALLREIGQALNDEPGDVTVTGHTDNQPISAWNRQFRSNQELSEKRAAAAADVLRAAMRDPARVRSQGYGDTYPVAGNATPEERAKNRRIEIIIQRPA